MDPIRLLDGDALAEVLDHHPHVVGDPGRPCAHDERDAPSPARPLLIGGGVVSTVTADAEAVDTVWYDAPPSFALHLVDDRAVRVTTQWRGAAAQ